MRKHPRQSCSPNRGELSVPHLEQGFIGFRVDEGVQELAARTFCMYRHVPFGPHYVNRLGWEGEWAVPTSQKALYLLTGVEE